MLQPVDGQPGVYTDTTTGENIAIKDYREGDKYDTIAIPAANVDLDAGIEFVWFQNIQNKRELDTNIKTPRKLSAGESMLMDRIGIYPCSSAGKAFPRPQHFKAILDNAFFRLKVNDILQCEGPSVMFPTGLGFYGNTTEDDQGIVALGVPATASASKLLKKQLLNQNHELDGVLRFDSRLWLLEATATGVAAFSTAGDTRPAINIATSLNPARTGGMLFRCVLHGLIKAAVSK